MTQTELEIKQNELSRAYCAKTEPIKREISEGDIKVREVRQDISRLYEELRNLRDHRTEMEHKLHQLRDEYLEEKTRLLRASEAEQKASPKWHPVSDTPDEDKLILCLATDGTKPRVVRGEDYTPLDHDDKWCYLDDLLPAASTHGDGQIKQQ